MSEVLSGRKNILQEISSTNTIAIELLKALSRLNKTADEHLSTTLLPTLEGLPDDRKEDMHLKELQVIFQDLYYMVGGNKTSATLDVSDKQLSTIASRWNNLTPPKTELVTDESYHNATNALNELINSYFLLILYFKKSNSLIVDAISYKTQLTYWRELQDSYISKFIYWLQSLPIRIYELAEIIVKNSLELFQDAHSFDVMTDARLLWSSSTRTVLNMMKTVPSFSFYQLDHGGFSRLHLLVQAPVDIINREIRNKIRTLEKQIDTHCEKLGIIISSLPRREDMAGVQKIEGNMLLKNLSVFETDGSTSLSTRTRICSILDDVNAYFDTRPSFVVRYWPLAFLLVVYGPSGSKNIYKNRYNIAKWIKYNFVDTIVGFGKNWVLQPIKNMLSILRNDENFQKVGIISKDSLQSDLDSLERMVVDYVADYNHEESARITREIHEAIQEGNLTMLMSNYEQDLRHPLKSLAKGSLIRAILIQIQKAKVDGAIMVSGIDKMLKSQQLLFGAVSLSPSLYILFRAYHFLVDKSSKPLVINGKQVNFICLKSLNSIEKLISQPQTNAKVGEIFIEIINLQLHSVMLIPSQIKSSWISDLNDLNTVSIEEPAKHSILRRIWFTYSYYFR